MLVPVPGQAPSEQSRRQGSDAGDLWGQRSGGADGNRRGQEKMLSRAVASAAAGWRFIPGGLWSSDSVHVKRRERTRLFILSVGH